MTLFQLSYLLLWVLAVFQTAVSVIAVYLLAQLRVQIMREGVGQGNNLIERPMPVFPVTDIASGLVQQSGWYTGQTHVVLAVSAGCGSCRGLLQELSSRSAADLSEIHLLVLCMGDAELCKEEAKGIQAVPVYVHEVKVESSADLWRVGFPAALVVDEEGVVVDVRHPLSIKGLLAAVRNATWRDRDAIRRTGDHSAAVSGG